ncbi:MAG: phosphoenolpyruvate--protein phosphotransferase [Alphaproteobacteria bacterium]|jgi:phosphotransferase system enzyme I (PtsP)|nr:phosphoenolpyruvate--protein phosphotransferase [Alphaproteobacteria bacterium]MDP6518224.1 phosphoenolpyruvate--protein phosphotransferase [Alphaproteobacteria bacterium]
MSGPRRLLRRLRDVMAAPVAAQQRLDQVVRIIAADMVAEVCSCYLMRAGEVLELFATQGLKSASVHRTLLRVGEGLVGTIAAYARPLNLADAQAHPLFAYRPETGEEIYQSLMGVPIMHGGSVVGVLVVQNKTRRHYDDEEVEALQVVAMVLAELVASGELVNPHELLEPGAIYAGPEVLEGLALVAGTALGAAVVHRPRVYLKNLVAEDAGRERTRLAEAVVGLQDDVDRMLAAPDLAEDGAHRDVLETYGMFARDSGWLARIDEAIGSGLTAEAAVIRVQEDMRARMSQAADSYIRERLLDFDDLANRLLRHLSGESRPHHAGDPDQDFVLVARTLGPAELVDYDRRRLKGLVLEEGSPTTHVAIVARAFEVPMVGRIRGAVAKLRPGEPVIVDGDHGRVFVRPAAGVIDNFREDAAGREARRAVYQAMRDKPARTRDGFEISLNINAGFAADLDRLDETGADGVGLCRTEIPFMMSASFPDVAAQTELYRAILDQAGDRSVVFRTLDIGGDKRLPYLAKTEEENPAMGWRAIRIGLDQPAVLCQQLRALLRAAAGRTLDVMFPMVADLAEYRAASALLDHEIARLRRQGETLPTKIQVGVMLEIPALMWQLPDLAAELDFVSVGTNDLIQFLYASDRANSKLVGRYGVLSPAALSLLEQLVRDCEARGVVLTVCGEAAGQTIEVMAMIGIGVRRFSMPPSRIGPIKLMVRSLRVAPLQKYLEIRRGTTQSSLRDALHAYARDHHINI